ncbi:porin family protein [Hymenobacter sp. ASUV-10]|uniref:Porin family protein n=1 Tax=Hymenobacter aranciens TaxID=3063996 RepID=A0ABT9B6H3_9BACT|nr:porin family protein [Hymenobacter sp. ASUV-10]MDO7873876.1 porin family protein [Hymenobacter sp. ASUV-10]
MPTVFRSLFFAAVVSLAGLSSAQARTLRTPEAPTDTVVIRLPNQAILTLMVRDAAQLRELKKYHLDSLTTRLAGYINRAETAAKTGTSSQVTMDFYPAQDQPGQNLPEQIRITTHKPTAGVGPSNKVEVFLEKNLHITVNTDGKKNDQPRSEPSREERQAKRDSTRCAKIEKDDANVDLIIDFGLNALVNQKTSATSPNVDLRTEGSRYFNIGFNYAQRLGGKRSPVVLSVGPEFAFNNYMLNDNNKWVNDNGVTRVVLEADPTRQYEKTKLATASINLPLMLNLKLHDKQCHETLHLGVGGFVGYRLKSWTKLKYTYEGTTYKDKDRGSYNLEDFQYGLQGILGYRGFELFAKYNMNQLFKENQGPNTQVVSFGVRIAGI